MGASGISSGDTVYIGAGTYRETVTVAMTSATAETKIVGDVTGQYTGDAGEVIWSAYTAGDFAAPASNSPLNLDGRDYLTVEQISIVGVVLANTQTSTNITFRNCSFFAQAGNAIAINGTCGFGVSWTWLLDGCRFVGYSYGLFAAQVTSASGADYNLNTTVQNCLFVGVTIPVTLQASGSATYRGNGITLTNCQFYGAQYPLWVQANANVTSPSIIRNCVSIGNSSTILATASGQITDGGGNRLLTGSFTNVTAHATTRAAGFPAIGPLELGQSAVLGLPYRHPLMPYAASGTYPGGALGFGNVSGGTSTSITGRSRPAGIGVVRATGSVTSATTNTLSDSGASFPINGLIGCLVAVGTRRKRISSNTATQLTISGAAPAGGLWATTPTAGEAYIVYDGPQVETGKATAGGATTLTDSGANWATNQWSGYTVEITGGSGVGSATVTSNTATALTVASWPNGNPDNTSTYSLYWPGGSVTATPSSAGAFELGDTAKRATGETGDCIQIDGPGCVDATLKVSATATTITCRAQYDGNHGTGSKPQLQLLAAGELGVSATTATMTSAADTWETLTIGPFTPTAEGIVTVRFVSRSATPYGYAKFDTFTVS